jgi:hypothetical protein
MNYHDTHHNVVQMDQKYPTARMEEATKSESDEVSSNAEDAPRRPSQAVPVQKRRRVTRACDEVSLILFTLVYATREKHISVNPNLGKRLRHDISFTSIA